MTLCDSEGLCRAVRDFVGLCATDSVSIYCYIVKCVYKCVRERDIKGIVYVSVDLVCIIVGVSLTLCACA